MTANPASIAEGLTEAQRRAYLSATPSIRAANPDSLFVRDARGCSGRDLPGTMVTMNGLMLTDLGLAVRAHLRNKEGE